MRRCDGPGPRRAQRECNSNGQCKRAFATLIHMRPLSFFHHFDIRRERIAIVESACKSHSPSTQDLESATAKADPRAPSLGRGHVDGLQQPFRINPATQSSSSLRPFAPVPGATAISVLRPEDARTWLRASRVPDHILRHPSFQWTSKTTDRPVDMPPAEPHNAINRHRRSEHVLLDPEVRHDLAADFLDRGMGGVERGNVLVAENAIRDDEFALAAVELGI